MANSKIEGDSIMNELCRHNRIWMVCLQLSMETSQFLVFFVLLEALYVIFIFGMANLGQNEVGAMW